MIDYSKFVKKYQRVIPSPLTQSIALAAITLPSAFVFKKPLYNLIKRRFQDPRISKTLFGLQPEQTSQALQQLRDTWFGDYAAPLLIGSLIPATALALNTVKDAPMYGWFDWNPEPELQKKASFGQDSCYQSKLDLSKSIDRRAAIDMINNNPFMASHDSYARNLGTSIISAAPSIGNYSTLGGVYDSAQDKFDKKLTFQGLTNKALKGVVSGTMAGMFTDIIGTAVGIPSNLSKGISNTIGIGKALHSILT